jgi:predicted DCC family thiol-disulfide oxidoreductase YuxK
MPPPRERPSLPVLIDRPAVLYDGRCHFCRVGLAAIARWDRGRRLVIVPFRDPLGARLARRVPEGERFGAVHLIAPGRAPLSGEQALAELFGLLPGGVVLRAGGLQRLYGPIARNRGRIGRLLPNVTPVRRVPPARG